MNEKTLNVLEFNKVKALVKEAAATSIGKQATEQLCPETTLEKVEALQTETDEALHILRLNKRVPFSHITNITNEVKRSVIGSTLSTDECLRIAQLIYCGRNIKTFMENIEDELPILQEKAASIHSLRHLEKEINEKIDEYGEVVDRASSKLQSLRSSIRTYESRIRERLNHLTKTKSNMLSEAIVTIRNDRYVLPVKQAYRSAIGGIVHDHSSSGQTLFMEPKAVIELNNELQQTILKEQTEVEAILRELTGEIANAAEALLFNQSVIAAIDFICARAHLAAKMKAARPKLNNRGIIKMKAARHPLIPADTVVANDIEIGDTYDAMVITGPNTGGKTVTLKLVGLAVLMAQSGLQVPALDGCEIGVFETVFADIGDEQSIEQNLSTFSSHMTNIVHIMQEVNEHSLVLFDELGAGTDPQEGAALAMAILDEVINRKARVIATTHYPELKAYGYNRDNVMNASVEFDVETLNPTYRLMLGVPGKSNAFEISERLGLQNNIINHAKQFIGIDSTNVENMIGALEKTKREAEKELIEAQALQEESERLKEALRHEWEQFQQVRDGIYEKAETKAAQAIEKARKEAEIIVSEVKAMKNTALWKEHEWIEARKLLDEAKPALVQKEDKTAEEQTEEQTTLVVGDEITHTTFQQQGEVVEILNDQEYVVQVGAMKINATRDQLIFKGSNSKERAAKESPVPNVMTAKTHVKTELDLRGTRYEDAVNQLEKYIDDAMVQGLSRVTIIHGKGSGALRRGVETFAKSHPFISDYRLGAHNEGGTGVTIIELN